jgi:type IV pilus assembly protein PilM
MAEKIITVFIRDDAVNLLEVEGKVVKKWASSPLESGLVSQGLVLDEAKVAEELDKLFKRSKIEARRVVAGLSGLNSLYRLISLPELPDAILPEAVKQEAKRVIPMPLDEVYLSYQRLPAQQGETRVFLAVFPRNTADGLVRTLRMAGLQPYVMDLAPLALCRTLDEPRAIIINTRFDHLDIMIMEDRLPQLIHRLSLSGEVTSASERLAAITEEVDRTVDFYNSSHGEHPLDSKVPVFVCSELVQAPEKWQSLGGKLGCPVSILPSPMKSPDGFDASDFMVNIGLALKELQYERDGANVSLVNFNALPQAYQPKGVSLSRILIRAGLVVGVGLMICMGFLIHGKSVYNSLLRAQIVPLQSSIALQMDEIAALQDQIGQVEEQLAPVEVEAGIFDTTLTSLEVGREQASAELVEIVDLLPTTMYLTGIEHEGDSMTVSGMAPSEDDVYEYARDLRGSFGSVIISSILVEDVEDDPTIGLYGWTVGYEFELLITQG